MEKNEVGFLVKSETALPKTCGSKDQQHWQSPTNCIRINPFDSNTLRRVLQ
jgi:hypothetical protein